MTRVARPAQGRGWLHIIRREWAEAEADLALAMDKASDTALRQRADICSALASLYRRQGKYDQAIVYAQQALNLREETGDLQRVADACANLGLIYDLLGEHSRAIAAQEEALGTFRQIGDREGIANAHNNIGAALYYSKRYLEAIEQYRKGLDIFRKIGLPRGEAQALQNLAEAFAALGQVEEARRHWREGYALSQDTHLDDQLSEFRNLRDRTPALQSLDTAVPLASATNQGSISLSVSTQANLLPVERFAIEIARQQGHVTAKRLMEQARISKPTATRALSDLVRRGLLVRMAGGARVTVSCRVHPILKNPAIESAGGDKWTIALWTYRRARFATVPGHVELGRPHTRGRSDPHHAQSARRWHQPD